jgi:hypothetical protein
VYGTGGGAPIELACPPPPCESMPTPCEVVPMVPAASEPGVPGTSIEVWFGGGLKLFGFPNPPIGEPASPAIPCTAPNEPVAGGLGGRIMLVVGGFGGGDPARNVVGVDGVPEAGEGLPNEDRFEFGLGPWFCHRRCMKLPIPPFWLRRFWNHGDAIRFDHEEPPPCC